MLASCWRTERVTRWKEDGAGSVEELGKPEAEDGNREEDGGWVSWIRERQPVREGAGGGEEAGAGGGARPRRRCRGRRCPRPWTCR
jgi:hypothetical protein